MQFTPHNSHSPIRDPRRGPSAFRLPHSAFIRHAFTLIEMVVSISILVIVILAVGIIFQAAGRAVGVSQASMEMLSNDRAIQQQLASDVAGIDKNAFLVIRSASYTDPGSGIARRCDQVSFISRGSFPSRTGTISATPFTDNFTAAPAAFIWWGQPAFEASGGTSGSSDPRVSIPIDSTLKVPLSQIPTGVADSNGNLVESSLALARHADLLAPPTPPTTGTNYISPDGSQVASYPNGTPSAGNSGAAIDYNNTVQPTANSTFDSAASDITQSRIDVAQCPPGLLVSYLMQGINSAGGRSTVPRYEADHYCYRYGVLRSPYDSTSLVNGYFRMHPIALQGVSSFIVEWTDGSVFAAGDTDPITSNKVASGDALFGTTRWYGYGNPKAGISATLDGPISGTGTTNGDSYCAIFSYDNRTQWPVALRFRYHVVDASGRLPNGRDFTEVVKVPN